jgi:PTH1 family peptidyl-tRNA hydrolase
MKLIVGLGNPGKEYEHTRHNMGFDVIDLLADRWHVTQWKEDMQAEIAQVTVHGEKVILMKPLTYMNNSGEAAGAAARYYKIPADDIYVVCDDLDLPPGKTRIRKKGSAGGHNGMKSLIAHLGTEEFNRFRIGIGHPKDGHTVVDHVLGRPYGEDIAKVEEAKKHTADSIEYALEHGVDRAMSEFNPHRK